MLPDVTHQNLEATIVRHRPGEFLNIMRNIYVGMALYIHPQKTLLLELTTANIKTDTFGLFKQFLIDPSCLQLLPRLSSKHL